jgi:hypothetical protein
LQIQGNEAVVGVRGDLWSSSTLIAVDHGRRARARGRYLEVCSILVWGRRFDLRFFGGILEVSFAFESRVTRSERRDVACVWFRVFGFPVFLLLIDSNC